MKRFKAVARLNIMTLGLAILAITGCQKNNNPANITENTGMMVFLPGNETGFNVENTSSLNALVKQLANEKREIKILEAGVKEFSDNLGLFKAVSAVYKIGEEVTRMVIPLSEDKSATAKDGQTANLYLADQGCEMKCTSAWGCSSCKQTIIERCKSQTCECTGGAGGCSSKITFPPPPPQN